MTPFQDEQVARSVERAARGIADQVDDPSEVVDEDEGVQGLAFALWAAWTAAVGFAAFLAGAAWRGSQIIGGF